MPCLNQGSPSSRSHTSVGPGLLRNRATQQAVNGRQVSEYSSVFTVTPHHLHPLVLGKIIFHKNSPFATQVGASWFKPLSLLVIRVKLSLTEVEATCSRPLDGKWPRREVPYSPNLEKGGAHRESPAGGDRQRGDGPNAGSFCVHRVLGLTLQ